MAAPAAAVASPNGALVYVALGAAILCMSALAGTVAAAGRMGLSPGRRALFHWTPIAITALVARAMGWGDVSLGVIFGTSVATLSTVLGSVGLVAPVGPAPAHWKRVWPFTLAAALIVFVSGFNGLLTWKHGVALALEGVALLSLWRDDSPEHEGVRFAEAHVRDLVPEGVEWGALALAVLLAAAGAYLATRGAVNLRHLRQSLSPEAIAASLFSLMLATPMVQGDRRLAQAGASWVPATAQVGIVLLNFCVLLPVLALVPYVTAYARALRFKQGLIVDWAAFAPRAAEFPLAVWRIDSVVLVILAVMLLPVSMGKWNLGREEGVVLIAAYCVYLLAVTVAGL